MLLSLALSVSEFAAQDGNSRIGGGSPKHCIDDITFDSMNKKLQRSKRKAALSGWLTFAAFVATLLLGIVGVAVFKIAVPWYVWVLLPLLLVFLLLNWLTRTETANKTRKEHIRASGRPATARLVKSETTGAGGGTSAVMKICLELTDEAGETWPVELQRSLSPDKYHLLAPGTEFKAWHLPDNRREVTVEGLD